MMDDNQNAPREWPVAPTFLSLRKGCKEDTANYNKDGIYYTDYLRGFLADLSHDKNIQNALSLFQFVPEDYLPNDPNAKYEEKIPTKPEEGTVLLNEQLEDYVKVILEKHKPKLKIIRIDSGTFVNNGRLCDAFRKCKRKCKEGNTGYCFKQDSIVGIFAGDELNDFDPYLDNDREKLKIFIEKNNLKHIKVGTVDTIVIKEKEKEEKKRSYVHYTCPISLFEEHIFPVCVHNYVIACLMLGQMARDRFNRTSTFSGYREEMEASGIDFDMIDITSCEEESEWNKKARAIVERIQIFETRLEERIEHRNTRYINHAFADIEQEFRKRIRRIRIKGYNAISEFNEALCSAFNEIRTKFDKSDDGFFRMFASPITTIQKELVLIGWSGELTPDEKANFKFSLKKLKDLEKFRDNNEKNEYILNGASQQIRDVHNNKDVFWYGTLADEEVAYIVWKRHNKMLYGDAFGRYREALKKFYSVVLECYSSIRGAKMALLLEKTIQQSAHESAHFIVPARDMVEKNLTWNFDKMILPSSQEKFSLDKKRFELDKQYIITLLNQLEEINNGSSLIFSEKISLEKTTQNVHELLSSLKKMFSRKATDYFKRIHYLEEKRFVVANIDVAYFNHALYNLVDNAVKYAYDGSNIYIIMDVDRAKDELKIQFKSFGIQIKEEDKDRIYHEFERGEDAALLTKGTGIGMYIVKKVCEAHGGKVWHNSEFLSEYNIPVLFNYRDNKSLKRELSLGEIIEYDKLYGKELQQLSGLIENEVVHSHNFVEDLDVFTSRIKMPTYRNSFFVSIPLT